MNNLPLSKQIEIISALCEGVGQRAVSRLTGTDRKTIARLALNVGRGCAELHDRMMVGLRAHRIECDELWAYVGHKRNPQKGPKRHPSPVKGDQYTYIGLGSASRAIIAYRTGKRDGAVTDDFIQDLRGRVIGAPEISTDGWHPYKPAIRDAFGKRATHGVINKTYSVTHLNVTEASRRYSPAAVVAVERVAVQGEPEHISTSYVERQNLTIRMGSKRFAGPQKGPQRQDERNRWVHVSFCRRQTGMLRLNSTAWAARNRLLQPSANCKQWSHVGCGFAARHSIAATPRRWRWRRSSFDGARGLRPTSYANAHAARAAVTRVRC